MSCDWHIFLTFWRCPERMHLRVTGEKGWNFVVLPDTQTFLPAFIEPSRESCAHKELNCKTSTVKKKELRYCFSSMPFPQTSDEHTPNISITTFKRSLGLSHRTNLIRSTLSFWRIKKSAVQRKDPLRNYARTSLWGHIFEERRTS